MLGQSNARFVLFVEGYEVHWTSAPYPCGFVACKLETDIATRSKVKLVTWPSPQDYNEAVQNPQTSFADEELRRSRSELTNLGLPKPRTGNFASVYRLTGSSGETAVRCFLHPLVDQEERYEALAECLRPLYTRFLLHFDFIAKGICVRGSWFPIVKMAWANGIGLIEFVCANLNNPAVLLDLAGEFRQAVLLLQANSIAHGDLQHGNIIVFHQQMKFVDYDGMFVPSLRGRPSNELGHRNYQHPRRSALDYNEKLDNFSAWVIWISLTILAEDPALWEELSAGDDCLLFRKSDFEQPLNSHAFSVLENHASERVRVAACFLRHLLRLDLDEIPGLDRHPFDPGDLPSLFQWREADRAEENIDRSESETLDSEENSDVAQPSDPYQLSQSQYGTAPLLTPAQSSLLLLIVVGLFFGAWLLSNPFQNVPRYPSTAQGEFEPIALRKPDGPAATAPLFANTWDNMQKEREDLDFNLVPNLAQSYLESANEKFGERQYNDAEVLYRSALNSPGGSALSETELATNLHHLVHCDLANKHYAKALTDVKALRLQKSAIRDPEMLMCINQDAVEAEFETHQFKQAIDDLRKTEFNDDSESAARAVKIFMDAFENGSSSVNRNDLRRFASSVRADRKELLFQSMVTHAESDIKAGAYTRARILAEELSRAGSQTNYAEQADGLFAQLDQKQADLEKAKH